MEEDRWYNSKLAETLREHVGTAVHYVGIALVMAATSTIIDGCNGETRIVADYNVGKYRAITQSSEETLSTLMKEIRSDDGNLNTEL